ncbi:hypothetical protein F4821DRAFT_275784 [Hypoxylon rubiginosum]|uniref:Uncharacterized protein n=1 Tax=Hypoxylon rubiginosum TaxID=110542 RepID=A0ACC0DB07_9PEZI|nr:hypothetical protein F4821DRAFT_275784 [Hypoxylon rubiginosum]
MVSFFVIAALWPIATSLALPCAEQPSAPGMICHDFHQPNGTLSSILVNDNLRARSDKPIPLPPVNGDPPHFYRMDDAGYVVDACGATMYFDHEYEQPQFADCDAIRQWASNNKGQWMLFESDQPASPASIILYQHNTCAFSVVMEPETKARGVTIGNSDVADIIHDKLYDEGNTLGGGRGYTACNFNTNDGQMRMRWYMVTPATAQDLPELHGLTN